MKVIIKKFPTDMPYMYILPIADLHIGDYLFNPVILKGFLDWGIAHDAYYIIDGDITNSALSDTPPNSMKQIYPPREQIDVAYNIMYPIRDRILAMVEGTHENWSTKRTGISPLEFLAQRLGGQEMVDGVYTEDGCILMIKLGHCGINQKQQVVYTFYVYHGSCKSANERAHDITDVDCFIAGHIHKYHAGIADFYRVDHIHEKVVKTKRYDVICGSFLEYGDYAQKRGLQPAHLGCPRLRLDGKRKDLHIEL